MEPPDHNVTTASLENEQNYLFGRPYHKTYQLINLKLSQISLKLIIYFLDVNF